MGQTSPLVSVNFYSDATLGALKAAHLELLSETYLNNNLYVSTFTQLSSSKMVSYANTYATGLTSLVKLYQSYDYQAVEPNSANILT